MKKFWLIAVMLMVCSMTWANPISKESARKIAEEFMTRKAASRGVKRAAKMMAAESLKRDAQTLDATIYLFNASDGSGFVIVSGDDRTEPILGYSETGNLDFDHMPSNLRSWLQHYADEIAFMQNHNLSSSRRAIANLGIWVSRLRCNWTVSGIKNTSITHIVRWLISTMILRVRNFMCLKMTRGIRIPTRYSA